MRLNAEGHDESQYLPRGIPPVNPFRAQHKGVRWEGTSIKAMNWLPDLMLDREFLTKDHQTTCLSFYSAVISTRKLLGITDLRGYLADSQMGDALPKDIFFAICNGLKKWKSNLCLWVVCNEYNMGNIELAYKIRGNIQESLEDAQKIIDNLRELARVISVPVPEVCQKLPCQVIS